MPRRPRLRTTARLPCAPPRTRAPGTPADLVSRDVSHRLLFSLHWRMLLKKPRISVSLCENLFGSLQFAFLDWLLSGRPWAVRKNRSSHGARGISATGNEAHHGTEARDRACPDKMQSGDVRLKPSREA